MRQIEKKRKKVLQMKKSRQMLGKIREKVCIEKYSGRCRLLNGKKGGERKHNSPDRQRKLINEQLYQRHEENENV